LSFWTKRIEAAALSLTMGWSAKEQIEPQPKGQYKGDMSLECCGIQWSPCFKTQWKGHSHHESS
jgi:hypothetical protein